MRKHGWQPPYHPLQVVAVAVFLALGFAFYVFFVPFVGKKKYEYVVMGLYTPLVTCVFCLYIWCAAADPGDLGVFKSKKYLNTGDDKKHSNSSKSRWEGASISNMNDVNAATAKDKPHNEAPTADAGYGKSANELEKNDPSCSVVHFFQFLLGWCPFSFICSQCHSCQQSTEQQSEDGMFYCSLCKVEVSKYSKHCRVCDKCVDGFDHHCRWFNNCVGRKNYKNFFILMVSAVFLLILHWSIGVLVLIRCFIERRSFTMDIASKLGRSFSLVPFVIVVGSCTFLAMVATLPLAQLFFFHALLIKKGISTYDYIIALREQEQQGVGGQQSPQMSPISSVTGMSSASSFSNFHRGTWCTPPRLFLEDQFDFVPADMGMTANSVGKKVMIEESSRKINSGTVKLTPCWTLARLNAEEVSKAAAQAKKKSRVLQPVMRRENLLVQEIDGSFGRSNDQMVSRLDNHGKVSKRGRLLTDLTLEPVTKAPASAMESNGSNHAPEVSTSLVPLQLQTRSAFHTSRAMSSTGIIASSPGSSLGSPDLHPFRVTLSEAEEVQGFSSLPPVASAAEMGVQWSRSTSDGYEASGGEDSDRVPSRIVHRSSNWNKLLFSSGRGDTANELKMPSSAGLQSRLGSY